MERPRSLEQQSASICGGLPAWGKKESELSQLNDGTATVRVCTIQECITAWTRVGYVTFNNDDTTTVRVSHYTTVHYGLNEGRVRNFQ